MFAIIPEKAVNISRLARFLFTIINSNLKKQVEIEERIRESAKVVRLSIPRHGLHTLANHLSQLLHIALIALRISLGASNSLLQAENTSI